MFLISTVVRSTKGLGKAVSTESRLFRSSVLVYCDSSSQSGQIQSAFSRHRKAVYLDNTRSARLLKIILPMAVLLCTSDSMACTKRPYHISRISVSAFRMSGADIYMAENQGCSR